MGQRKRLFTMSGDGTPRATITLKVRLTKEEIWMIESKYSSGTLKGNLEGLCLDEVQRLMDQYEEIKATGGAE